VEAKTKPGMPAERTTGSPERDAAIKEGGGIPAGIMKGDESIKLPELTLFHDPKTGSTLALPTEKVTSELVKAHIAKSREAYNLKTELSAEPNPEPQTAQSSKSKGYIPTKEEEEKYKSWGKTGPKQAPGMIEPGNIDLTNRPVIHNEDGSISSEYSTSFGDSKGHEILVPTVVNGKFLTPNGKKPKVGSPEEKAMFRRAQEHYEQTGEHMGIFDSPKHADAVAEEIHNRPWAKFGPSAN